MLIFYQEKAFHAGKKIRKNYFAPSEKFSRYTPDSNDNWKPKFYFFFLIIAYIINLTEYNCHDLYVTPMVKLHFPTNI